MLIITERLQKIILLFDKKIINEFMVCKIYVQKNELSLISVKKNCVYTAKFQHKANIRIIKHHAFHAYDICYLKNK